jgi:hypothetical protein
MIFILGFVSGVMATLTFLLQAAINEINKK